MTPPDSHNSKSTISCPHCGKTYPWQANAANRKFRCNHCQAKFRFPSTIGGKSQLLEPPQKKYTPPTPTPDPNPNSEPQTSPTDNTNNIDADADTYELNLDNVDDQFFGKKNDPAPTPPTSTTPTPSKKIQLGPEHDLSMIADELTPGTPLLHPPDDNDELAKLPPPVFNNTPGAPRSPFKPGRCPSCGGKINPNAVICVGCGFNLLQQKKIETQIGTPTNKPLPPVNPTDSQIPAAMLERIQNQESKRADDDDESRMRMRDIILPGILIPIGLLLQALAIFVLSTDVYLTPFASAISLAFVIFIIIPITIASAFIIAKIMGLNFGPLGPAILKLSAISLFPGAVGDLVAVGFNAVVDIGGSIAGWMVSLSLVLALICYFFRMDLGEAWAVVITMGVIKFILGMLFLLVILTTLLP